MSHRGRKAKSEAEWRTAQYRQGRSDGLAGRNGVSANSHYQRGYRAGRQKRKEKERSPQ
jgi:hypothetical protein